MKKNLDCVLLHFLVSFYAIACMYVSWNTLKPSFFSLCCICIIGFLTCVICALFENKVKWVYLILLIPYFIVAIWPGYHHGISGFFSWINTLLEQYNTIHDCGIPLLKVPNYVQGIRTFTIFFSLLQMDILYGLLHLKRKKECIYVYIFIWIILLLNIESLNVFLFILFVILFIFFFVDKMTNLTRHWLYCTSICALAFSFILTSTNSSMIHTFKEDASDKIHDVRYGENVLPLGDLLKANLLSRGTDTRMVVTSDQIKDLYLKAYVGSTYNKNRWVPLSNSAYGYENNGMLKWLKKHNFDPFTQVSRYYELGKEKIEENKVDISVQSASREYLYSVSSVSDLSSSSVKKIQDYNLLTKGMFGKEAYSWQELSTDKPYELMTSNDWLQNPTTKQQKEYIEAESVYRQFVYDHYLKIDQNLNAFLQTYFWQDYNPQESDSIYGAIQQIRTCLEKNTSYEKQMDSIQNEEVVEYFLKRSKKGNSAFYATVATLALRSYGIPARYVEGYYVSKDALENEKSVQVKGHDAHAWTEIYYDGIGWVPVDFSPGFYDEPVALQKMISAPNATHKTAGVRKNKMNKADEIYSSSSKGKNNVEESIKHVMNVLGIVLGILAILILAFTCLFVLIEIAKLILVHYWRKKYDRADADEKVRILKRFMDRGFKLLNMSIYFGWNVKQADEKIAKCVEDISKGDFERVSYLVEKNVYGGVALEEFELRTIRLFVEKLYAYGNRKSFVLRMKMHFSILRLE